MECYLFLFLLSFVIAIGENIRLSNFYFKYGSYDYTPCNSILILTIIFIFSFVSGFRYQLGGSDYSYYEYFYSLINGNTDFVLTLKNSQYEIGYTTFVYICSNIFHLSFNGSLLVESCLFYLMVYIGLRRYVPNWGIFLMFFMYKMFFYVTMVAMRQAFTIGGFFLLMRFLQERKMIKYYVSLLLVVSFHSGALLLFFIYPLFVIDYSKEKLKIIGFVFAILTLFSGYTGNLLNTFVDIMGWSSLADKASGYASGSDSLNILYTIEYFILYYLIIKNYERINSKFKNAKFIINLFLVAIPIVTIFRSTSILVRELYYFYPSYAILVYYIYVVYKERNKLIFSVFVSLCLLGLIKYVIQFDNGHFLFYKSWLCNSQIQFFQ